MPGRQIGQLGRLKLITGANRGIRGRFEGVLESPKTKDNHQRQTKMF